MNENVKIKIQDHSIRGGEKAKYLGIVFDNKLKFVKQIEVVKGKVNKAVDILRYLNRNIMGNGTEHCSNVI